MLLSDFKFAYALGPATFPSLAMAIQYIQVALLQLRIREQERNHESCAEHSWTPRHYTNCATSRASQLKRHRWPSLPGTRAWRRPPPLCLLGLLRRCLRSSSFRFVLFRGPSGLPYLLKFNLGFLAAALVTPKEHLGHESCLFGFACHNPFHDKVATHVDAHVTLIDARCQLCIGIQTRQRCAQDGSHCCGSLLRVTGIQTTMPKLLRVMLLSLLLHMQLPLPLMMLLLLVAAMYLFSYRPQARNQSCARLQSLHAEATG